jgi:hypothetical protein
VSSQSNKGSVTVLDPVPLANAEEAMISCRASEAGTKVTSSNSGFGPVDDGRGSSSAISLGNKGVSSLNR